MRGNGNGSARITIVVDPAASAKEMRTVVARLVSKYGVDKHVILQVPNRDAEITTVGALVARYGYER